MENILTFQKFYEKEPIPEWFVCVENGHAIPISRQDAEQIFYLVKHRMDRIKDHTDKPFHLKECNASTNVKQRYSILQQPANIQFKTRLNLAPEKIEYF